MAPPGADAEAAFYAGLADLPIGGLELPLALEDAPSLEPAWSARNLRPEWDLLLTCVPVVMRRLGADAAYGLSSTDDDGRRRALADVARARDLAHRLADEHGRASVVAIQVHSAPGPQGGSREALERSLGELLTWDLLGADLLLEHVDAPVAGRDPVKGFLRLDDEIAALASASGGRPVDAVDAAGGSTALGVSINWGRSAIEGRSAHTPVEHVAAAVDAGLLGAVVLSGATDVKTPWGPVWDDAHIPPCGDDPALAASSASLLGPDETAATLAAARAGGNDPFVAVKIAVRPMDADVVTRLAVARAALAQVTRVAAA
ncbi:DUF4862 family protein [Cellulomonas fimi]|uniref:DUF4862 family protein n=2 Tax=Cellulomonas fimi TaxID=1708 RepID=A0A7Y0LXU7_CELFI|nr:DUF4862 family protein [Cellulomonas fimi]